jgi:hypothetical protein
MGTGKNKTALLLAILFSFSFHFIALAGFKGFSLVNPVTPAPFFASLESDSPQHLPLPGPKKTSVQGAAGKTPGSKQEALTGDREDLSAPAEKGDARPAEEERDSGSHSVTQGDTRADEMNGGGEGKQEGVSSGQEEKTNALRGHFREKLYYELYWLGIYVGNATFEAVNDNGEMKITSRVHSAPVVSAFYEVEDYAESRIVDGAPVHFRIMQREGKYRSNKETIFDPTEKKVIFLNHLKETRDEHAMPGTALWDVISAFYYLRTQSLETGKTLSLAVFDSNKFLTAEVFVLGKERLEAFDRNGTETVIVRPVLKSEGLFKNQGTILVWLTDDEYKVPVKVETEVPVGKVIARLAGRESD